MANFLGLVFLFFVLQVVLPPPLKLFLELAVKLVHLPLIQVVQVPIIILLPVLLLLDQLQLSLPQFPLLLHPFDVLVGVLVQLLPFLNQLPVLIKLLRFLELLFYLGLPTAVVHHGVGVRLNHPLPATQVHASVHTHFRVHKAPEMREHVHFHRWPMMEYTSHHHPPYLISNRGSLLTLLNLSLGLILGSRLDLGPYSVLWLNIVNSLLLL